MNSTKSFVHINGRYLQRGVSLIGIMVGMMLSLITILAGLVLYRTIVSTSVDSRVDAAHDGQLASAMLSLQLELQSAGYGLSDAPNTLVSIENGESGAIYWRYKVDPSAASSVCRGFRIKKEADNSRLRLFLLQNNTCNALSSVSSLGAEEGALLADLRDPPGDEYSLPIITVTNNGYVACFPYGMSAAAAATTPYPLVQQVTVNIKNLGRSQDFNYTFCLSNIKQP